jgi:formylglycine-generating enzyme required for sulfatase activity
VARHEHDTRQNRPEALLGGAAGLLALLLAAAGCESEPPPEHEPVPCVGEHCEQVEIPAGEFTKGSTLAPDGSGLWWYEDLFADVFDFGDERDPHPVSLDRFFIDKYEVTYQRYHDCVRAGVCDADGHRWNSDQPLEGDPVAVDHYPEHCYEPDLTCQYYPVNCKSYQQAVQYCGYIGRRLCTEAEWERAAQGPGPEQREYPWGDAPPDTERARLWVYDDDDDVSGSEPEPVVPVNEHPLGATDEGVYGLAGNVFEWVADWYGPYPGTGGAVTNPTGPSSGERRVARGGCFHTSHFEARNSARLLLDPAFDWG